MFIIDFDAIGSKNFLTVLQAYGLDIKNPKAIKDNELEQCLHHIFNDLLADHKKTDHSKDVSVLTVFVSELTGLNELIQQKIPVAIVTDNPLGERLVRAYLKIFGIGLAWDPENLHVEASKNYKNCIIRSKNRFKKPCYFFDINQAHIDIADKITNVKTNSLEKDKEDDFFDFIEKLPALCDVVQAVDTRKSSNKGLLRETSQRKLEAEKKSSDGVKKPKLGEVGKIASIRTLPKPEVDVRSEISSDLDDDFSEDGTGSEPDKPLPNLDEDVPLAKPITDTVPVDPKNNATTDEPQKSLPNFDAPTSVAEPLRVGNSSLTLDEQFEALDGLEDLEPVLLDIANVPTRSLPTDLEDYGDDGEMHLVNRPIPRPETHRPGVLQEIFNPKLKIAKYESIFERTKETDLCFIITDLLKAYLNDTAFLKLGNLLNWKHYRKQLEAIYLLASCGWPDDPSELYKLLKKVYESYPSKNEQGDLAAILTVIESNQLNKSKDTDESKTVPSSDDIAAILTNLYRISKNLSEKKNPNVLDENYFSCLGMVVNQVIQAKSAKGEKLPSIPDDYNAVYQLAEKIAKSIFFQKYEINSLVVIDEVLKQLIAIRAKQDKENLSENELRILRHYQAILAELRTLYSGNYTILRDMLLAYIDTSWLPSGKKPYKKVAQALLVLTENSTEVISDAQTLRKIMLSLPDVLMIEEDPDFEKMCQALKRADIASEPMYQEDLELVFDDEIEKSISERENPDLPTESAHPYLFFKQPEIARYQRFVDAAIQKNIGSYEIIKGLIDEYLGSGFFQARPHHAKLEAIKTLSGYGAFTTAKDLYDALTRLTLDGSQYITPLISVIEANQLHDESAATQKVKKVSGITMWTQSFVKQHAPLALEQLKDSYQEKWDELKRQYSKPDQLYDVLCGMLKAYIGGWKDFPKYRTHTPLIQAILTLSVYDPKNKNASFFGANADALKTMIIDLRALEGFNEEGDLAAMISVIEDKTKARTRMADKKAPAGSGKTRR